MPSFSVAKEMLAVTACQCSPWPPALQSADPARIVGAFLLHSGLKSRWALGPRPSVSRARQSLRDGIKLGVHRPLHDIVRFAIVAHAEFDFGMELEVPMIRANLRPPQVHPHLRDCEIAAGAHG